MIRTLARLGHTDRQIAGDLVQDTFLKMCAKNFRVLRNFRGSSDGELRAYLRAIAASVVTDHMRGAETPAISLDSPGVDYALAGAKPLEDVERNVLLNSVEHCLGREIERDRRIFWLYHRHGFTPRAISLLPAMELSQSGIETLLYRLTKLVGACLKKRGLSAPAGEGVSA